MALLCRVLVWGLYVVYHISCNGGYHFLVQRPHMKDYNMFGSMLGSAYAWNAPHAVTLAYRCMGSMLKV